MDIYTIGGGEIVYEVLKAVAMCLNGGSGLLEAMLRVGGLAGSFMAYYMIVYGNPMAVLRTWGIPVLLVTNTLFLPTSTVWIKDTITRHAYKIDKVPYGLALFASQTSKLGKTITEQVEQSFSIPEDMNYQQKGFMFGASLLERSKNLRMLNPNFKENFRNFCGQCVKYDIMLNQKYSFEDLKNSNNLWELISRNPSKNRGIYWIPIQGKGMATYVTCEGAVGKFNEAWAKEIEDAAKLLGRKMFTGRFIANSGSLTPKLTMSPEVEEAIKRETLKNLVNVTGYLGDMASSAEDTLKQMLIINGLGDAASENSKLAGNAITYGEARAMQQQAITFDTIGRLAGKLLPIMKAVIEALAYACFIFIIPLCMVPSGYKILKNWVGVLIWLQAWPPMYAILNYIMHISARASTITEIGTSGGLTIANYMGVADANTEIKLLAGFLSMSIPFLCIAIVKGVGTFVHLASQMTGTSMSAAGSSAAEVSSGNFSFGNVSVNNRQMDNMSQLQRSYSSSLSAGGHTLNTGGVQITNDASGFSTYNHAVSSGVTDYAATSSNTEALSLGIAESDRRAHEAGVNLSAAQSRSHTENARMAESISHLKAEDISSTYNQSAEQAKNIMDAAKVINSHNQGHSYTDGTSATGGFNVGANAGGHVDVTKGAGGKDGKQASASANVGANAGVNIGGGVQSTNTTHHGDGKSGDVSAEYAKAERTLDAFSKSIAASDRNDALTQQAREHQHTLQDIDTYSSTKSYSEQVSKDYREASSRENSLTFAERKNLAGEAWEIGQEDNFGGYDRNEAERIMNSSRPEDKQIRDKWLMEAKGRNEVRMSPNKPSGPTKNEIFSTGGYDNKGYSRPTAENALKSEYAEKEQVTQAAIKKIDGDREAKVQALGERTEVINDAASGRIKDTNDVIENKKQEVTNSIMETRQKGKERSDKGAGKAALDKAIDTFNPLSKKED